MKKLSKLESKKHERIMELVRSDRELTEDEKVEIFDHFNPAATNLIHNNAAYFTPRSVAREMMIEVTSGAKRICDLGAGIGVLSYYLRERFAWDSIPPEIVCLDNNPEYVEIGKRVLPEATWICGDMFDQVLIESLGRFDEVISNPPYGLHPKNGWLHKQPSQYMAAEVAMTLAPAAVFLLLQGDCPFMISGCRNFRRVDNEKYETFHERTGVHFHPNCGIDLDPRMYNGWKNLSSNMIFEIVNVSMANE